jgi:[acyl-carrier-protein] S-malonyltransferase
MLAPWLALPGAAATVARWSELAGLDLVAAGTAWDADAIRATDVAQPLLAATALLSAASLPDRPDVVTGHSVGAWVAAAVAGVISSDDCVRLVAARGRAMAGCCDGTTGMVALLGGTEVSAALDARNLTAANVNGAGQIVAAGTLAELEQLREDPPGGARVRPLPVAGAFHSAWMRPAVDALAPLAQALAAADPTTTLIADTDGTVVTDGAAYLADLVAAIARPVRFDLVWTRLAELGVDRVLELAPAGVLSGLAKRCLPGIEIAGAEAPVAA